MICKKLKAARMLKNISENEMANTLGLSINEYLSYENNIIAIGIGTLYKVCTILELQPSYFFEV